METDRLVAKYRDVTSEMKGYEGHQVKVLI